MPRIETSLDEATEAAFRALAKHSSMTRSALLRHLIATVLQRNQASGSQSEYLERRSKRIYVHATPELFRAVEDAATQAGMTRPSVVLATLRARFAGTPTIVRSETEALARTAFELGKVGTNLNQLVRLLHQKRQHPDLSKETLLIDTSKAVSDLRKQINTLIETATARWSESETSQ